MADGFASVPAASAERFDVAVEDGVTIAAYEFHSGRDNAPVLFWAHANGFSAGCYTPFLERLTARFRVFAYDVRGQGGSTAPPEPYSETLVFDRFARDMEAVTYAATSRAGDAPLYFGGHSFSAATMYHLGSNLGFAPWRAITTFDATMRPDDLPEVIEKYSGHTVERIARTSQRRRDFPDRAAFIAAMNRPGRFDTFAPDMMEAYARGALAPHPSGEGFTLACPPEVEAGVYAGVRDVRPWRGLVRFPPIPAHVLGADPDRGGTWVGAVQPYAAERLPNARFTEMTGCGHLMPQERPDECAGFVLEMLG